MEHVLKTTKKTLRPAGLRLINFTQEGILGKHIDTAVSNKTLAKSKAHHGNWLEDFALGATIKGTRTVYRLGPQKLRGHALMLECSCETPD